MTRYAAHRKATLCWAHLGTAFTRIRRKSIADRFEAGYWNKQLVILGAGPTWEIAFERALGRLSPSKATPRASTVKLLRSGPREYETTDKRFHATGREILLLGA